MTVDAFDVVGHVLARSRTFGQGLERVVAYSRILHDAGRVELERRDARVVVFPGCRGLVNDFPRQIAEFSAASVLVLGRATTGKDFVATAVRFRHAAPPSVGEHVRVFGVKPTFDAHETEVELDAAVLDLPIPEAQSGLLTYLDAYARDVLAKLPVDDDLVGDVERAIASAMSRGVPDMDSIATQLGASTRTLQRRLGEAETGFQELVDVVRRRYAERYLADDRLAISEIAFLVGFSEPSNFHRAFRRWTGLTPAAFRGRAAT
jgi:AraC-like DNA-binding protein